MNRVDRIAYVLKTFPQVTQTFIVSELAELRRRGIEVLIVSLRPPPETLRHQIVADAGLDALTVYDPNKFHSALRDFHPKLLHAHFATNATAAARSFAAELEVPFTFTAHGYDIYFHPPKDFRERALGAAAVVTVSKANRRHISSNCEVPQDRIHVIPNGVDTDFFCPASEVRAAGEGPPLIVCVARLERVKNLPMLLEACAMLRDRGIKFRCVLIGEGEVRGDLESLRHSLGLDSLVEMRGEIERSEIRRWWRRAAVAVLSSDSEGMPVSLIEAAACGVPVVATRVGGIPELITDGVNGLLAPPRDPASLADALAQILEDPERSTAIGHAARQRVVERFSLGLQIDRLLRLWQSILDQS
jgi:glycosyltransferase involved in cell wall biosynthesis